MKYILLTNISYFPDYGGVENSIKYLSKAYWHLGYKSIILVGQSKGQAFKRLTETPEGFILRFRFRPFNNDILNLIFLPYSTFDFICCLLYVKYRYKPVMALARNQLVSPLTSLLFNRYSIYLAPGFSKNQQKSENLKSATISGLEILLGKVKRFIHSFFDRLSLKLAQNIFVFSDNMYTQALNCYPKSRFKIGIVKPGVDTDFFKPASSFSDKVKLRRKLLVPENKHVILAVGRFVSAKGFDLLLNACKELPCDWHLIIVGDGRDFNYLTKLKEKWGICHNVSFPGKVDNVNEFYRCADVFVMSSRYEPLGQTLLEAMATGTPIISFRNGGAFINATQEVVGNLATYTDENNVTSLIKCITKTLMLPSTNLKEQSSSLRSLAEESYSWNTLAKTLLKSVKD